MTRHTDAPGTSPDANDDRSEPESEREGPADPPEERVNLVNFGDGDQAHYAGDSVRSWILADTDDLVSLEENR